MGGGENLGLWLLGNFFFFFLHSRENLGSTAPAQGYLSAVVFVSSMQLVFLQHVHLS